MRPAAGGRIGEGSPRLGQGGQDRLHGGVVGLVQALVQIVLGGVVLGDEGGEGGSVVGHRDQFGRAIDELQQGVEYGADLFDEVWMYLSKLPSYSVMTART